ncbi:putative signal transduction protein with CBS domains [Desulfofarcimen acetoxidans DSM 771]|jgi:CBS domain-containing protein|uniref:Putative signal transduction protein with CBS domains n=1 Tax=Desulfofarcimen acetoxidans (strain ATCC 49208 / DSM 771 / KCTC 5769 / VKM B-1644 / 5575) TaxID=485916 RepID=C8W0B7_DESAS|nr:CBS domain-containing protein [Desulfofarcimen acetoxidans]ACV63172.1 putative signal transduction protein with CBS domains [Desulfofarcimen acetoxidans DSM 771]
MKKVLAKEVMIPVSDYTIVKESGTVKDAINALKATFFLDEKGIAQGHRSLLVVNDHDELVGVMTVRSILQALVIAEKDSGMSKDYLWVYLLGEIHKSAGDIPIKKVMRSKKVASVKVDDDLMIAVELMVRNGINSVPVLDDGKVVGVIRGIDVFNMIGELL